MSEALRSQRLRFVLCCQHQDYKVLGLDCMKMWPWMRDLPTSVWAGHGWAFDENGLRRLSSSGGSHAMQGVEVFESVGVASEEVKLSDEKIRETPIAVAAAECPLPFAEGQKPAGFRRINVAKQSGVPNVVWGDTMQAWCVQFYEQDAKGQKTRRTSRRFSLKHFMGPGVSEAQANTAALESAKAFRAELVEKGILSEPKPRDPNFTSEVPGVKWRKNRQKWHVEITPKGGKKKIHGGLFTEKAAAEAKALEIVEKAGLQRQVKPVANLSELPVFQPKVPYPGVTWEQKSQQWHAQCRVAGANRHFTVKPKDHSEAELERSFQVAVAWRRKQEKENQKEKEKEINAVKSKVKPGRKQRK